MLARILAASAVLFGSTTPAPGTVGALPQTHEDERLGYRIRIPRGWTRVPQQKGEQWVVAKYLSDEKHLIRDTDSERNYTYTPQLRVIAFVESIIQAQESLDVDEDDGEEQTRSVPAIRLGKVYHDYAEYMRETYGVGYYVAEEVEKEHRGRPVKQLVLRVERASMPNFLLVTWIYDTDIGEIAVEFELLEKEHKKSKSEIEKTLESFTTIDRTQPLVASSNLDEVLGMSAWRGLSPEERAERRRHHEERDWERMTQDLPEEWTAREIKGIRVLNSGSDKYAGDVVDAILAIYEWLDEAFPEVGAGEYTRKPIVRICKDASQELAFRRDGTSWTRGTSIVTHREKTVPPRDIEWESEWEYVNYRTLVIWFQDRDLELFWALPQWLARGLEEVIESALPTGSRLKFRQDDWEQNWQSEGEPIGRHELMIMGAQEFFERSKPELPQNFYGRCMHEAVALTRFLVSARGQHGRVLTDYLNNLRDVLDEVNAEEDWRKEGGAEPLTEEEEEERLAERRAAYRANERRILDETYRRTFASWSSKELGALERAYRRSIR